MNRISNALQRQSQFFLSIFLGLMGFSTYFCMYAFRKPFTAGIFEGISWLNINYKIILIVAQVLGYATAKGLGIKIVSEVKPHQRINYLLLMIGFSGINLLLFALVIPPYNFIFMYFNGLGLGMVYGMVFSFLEGRRITEILGAGLAVSFIVSSGIVKSIGKYFINVGMSEFWMPFVTGLIFTPLLLLSVYGLSLAPAPTIEDQISRTERKPMNAQKRGEFLRKYGFGMFWLILIYVLVTIIRDVRDNFGVEIWEELGGADAAIFSKTELIIGLIICVLTGLLFVVKNNQKAFFLNHLMIMVGGILLMISGYCFQHSWISSFVWTVLMGLGLYMIYVPFNGMIFDRLLAVLQENGNVGFLFYLADFCGYLSTVFVLFYQNFGNTHISWLSFLLNISTILPIFCFVFTAISFAYFYRQFKCLSKN